MPVAEMQARVFFDVFAGSSRLPDEEVMIADIDKNQNSLEKRYVRSLRHTIQVDYIEFMDELAGMIDCMPHPFKLILTDPKLAHQMLFGANVAYVYRLRGRHAWSGARDAILTAQERCDKALSGRDAGVVWRDNSTRYAGIAFFVLFLAWCMTLL